MGAPNDQRGLPPPGGRKCWTKRSVLGPLEPDEEDQLERPWLEEAQLDGTWREPPQTWMEPPQCAKAAALEPPQTWMEPPQTWMEPPQTWPSWGHCCGPLLLPGLGAPENQTNHPCNPTKKTYPRVRCTLRARSEWGARRRGGRAEPRVAARGNAHVKFLLGNCVPVCKHAALVQMSLML